MFHLDFNRPCHVHFIGIGGISMSGLAEILMDRGFSISGSDCTLSPLTERLASRGVRISGHQKASNITPDIDLVVYSAAIHDDNPELKEALMRKIPAISRAELLGALMKNYETPIAVAGTHGKTTTTSMLAHILLAARTDPTISVGGVLKAIGGNVRIGSSKYFLMEACEYTNSFLHFFPKVAVILNIDEDHLDYFKTLDNLKASFTKFADNATNSLVINGDDENTLDAVKNIKDKKIVKFGIKDTNDYYASNVDTTSSAFPSFDIVKAGKTIGHVNLSIPGEHNVFNTLAAIACAMEAGVTIEECISAIEEFRGAGRRFEFLGKHNGITVADDYAHHPKELEVTLNAAMKMGYNKVWAIFQPFTYSRTKLLFDDFVKVLQIPDKCVMTEIMGSREVNTIGIYTSHLAEKIPGSVWFNTFEEIAKYVTDNAQDGDLIITLGCGDIYKAADIIVDILKSKQK